MARQTASAKGESVMASHKHAGLFGLLVGIAGGIVAAILLAPKRREGASMGSHVLESTISGGLDLLEAAVEGYDWVRERATSLPGTSGMLPDERLTSRIQQEVEARGLSAARLDITTVDGVVYLRGKEPDAARVETIVGIANNVPGVINVVDEVRRE
jgi:hypothetical protein